MRRVGTPSPIIESSFSTIEKLDHYIRSTYGDSTKSFSSRGDDKPNLGVGQGNGAGPGIWAVVSTPIFDSMRRRGFGIYLQCPLSGEEFHFIGYAFVDDTDLCTSDDPTKPVPEYIIPRVQESLNWWESTCRTTGGDIRPDKCHWFLIDFIWHHGKWKYVPIHPDDPPLTVQNPYGRREVVPRMRPDQGPRTLGFRTAPDGKNTAEYEYIEQCIADWVEKVRTKNIPPALVWQSMTTGLFRKILWVLVCTTFTEDECDKLLQPLLWTGLCKSNIVRTLKRAVVHGPRAFCGLALPHFYMEQGIYKVQRICKYTGSYGYITGSLMRDSLENLTLELGLPGHPMSHDFDLWQGLTTDCWIKCAWQFMNKYGIEILTSTTTLSTLREGDSLIMWKFYRVGIREPRLLKRLNSCRMFLNAISLADLCNAAGTKILEDAWNGIRPTSRRSMTWAKQPPSKALDWVEWQSALNLAFVVSRHRRLVVPQGEWFDESCLRCWYFSEKTDRLIRKRNPEHG